MYRRERVGHEDKKRAVLSKKEKKKDQSGLL